MGNVPDEVRRHYEAIDEEARITQGIGRLERARVQEIVRRFLPGGALTIADVGGGTGVHASWLAEDGHRVHLIDPMPNHVQAARRLASTVGEITAQLGEASHLPFDDDSMDAVLLFGPLYHLTDRQERLDALREAIRVARPGAPVFAAAVSRFASLFDGLLKRMIFEPEFRRLVEKDLQTGQHQNPRDDPRWFTTAHFHHADELRQEGADAGLHRPTVLGVEGIGEWFPRLADDWDDPERQATIIWAARAIESEPTLLGLSAHLVLVGHKGASSDARS